MKKFSAFLLILLCLALTLAVGCKQTPKPSETVIVDTSAEEEFFLDIPSELVGTKVQVATWGTLDDETVLGFEQMTGIKTELVMVAQNEYINKLIGLIAADQAPDIVTENGDFPRTLLVLQPLLPETTCVDVTDPFWNQNIVDLYTVGKYCYIVNVAKDNLGAAGACTYFNRTTLEENGIKTPTEYVAEDNWNLETLSKLMQQIQDRCGYDRRGSVIDATAFLNVFGASETKWDSATDTFSNGVNSPEMATALQWLLKESEKGNVELMLEGSHASLAQGRAALQIAGAYGLRSYPGWFYEMDVDDLGFAPLPKINADDADYPYTAAVGGKGICLGARNPKGAGYYLRYSMNPDFVSSPSDQYKNEEAEALYLELCRKADYSKSNFNRGVRLTAYPHLTKLTDGLMGQVIWSSSSQVRIQLSSASNQVDSSVVKANELIASVIAEQK